MNPTQSPLPNPATPRTGKIARLPVHLRHDLNQRLLDNLPAPNILSWLNALPETRQILRDHFQNNPVSPQNLSEWRQGGYREWLLRDELLHHASGLQDSALCLHAFGDPSTLADNLATVLAARYAALLNTWDGEPTPAFEAKVKLLRSLSRDILALQKSLHRAQDLRRQRAREDHDQAAAAFEKAKQAALAQLKIPYETRHKDFFYGPAARAIAETEAASTPEELAAIQPNQTTSNPPPPTPSPAESPKNLVNLVNPVQKNALLPSHPVSPPPRTAISIDTPRAPGCQ